MYLICKVIRLDERIVVIKLYKFLSFCKYIPMLLHGDILINNLIILF